MVRISERKGLGNVVPRFHDALRDDVGPFLRRHRVHFGGANNGVPTIHVGMLNAAPEIVDAPKWPLGVHELAGHRPGRTSRVVGDPGWVTVVFGG